MVHLKISPVHHKDRMVRRYIWQDLYSFDNIQHDTKFLKKQYL